MACRGSAVRIRLAPLNEYLVTERDFRGLHRPLFKAKQLNIIFCAPICAPNGGKWLSDASPEQL